MSVMRTRTGPMVILAAMVMVSVGCKSETKKTPDTGLGRSDMGLVADQGAPSACTPEGTAPQVVSFTTEDGVKLEADLYLSGAADGPAAVLLHMIPPANDRTNYPKSFIEALVAKGLTVLNVDRRGAGKSAGEATDAYTGPKGKLDAKAAVVFLTGHACPPDSERLVLIGASNGSTTALDFTVYADSEASLELPRALVFLTGGTYTEAQNKIADHRTLLDQLPILFVYSDSEAQWSESFEKAKAASWEFKKYIGGDHGTRMFAAKPESIDDVVGFVHKAFQ